MIRDEFKVMLRWLVLVASLVLAAFFLNSALFSAWNAGGPPNAYREAWEQRSLAHLAYAGSLLLGGFGLFRFIRGFPRPGFIAVAVLLVALSLALSPHVRALLAQDACLDGGGRWLKSEFRCEM